MLLEVTTTFKLLVGFILGIVQGISEWLPISSKTQIYLVSSYLLHLDFKQAYALGLFMEAGTIIASVIYFRKDLYALVRVLFGSKDPIQRKLFVYVLVATLITGAIGAPIYIFAENNVAGVAIGIPMLIIGAVLLADAFVIRYSRMRQTKDGIRVKKFADLKFRDYVFIGIAQGIAALPGVSRSGITTSIMLLMNVEPSEAFRLSFLIGIFAAIAASGLTVVATRGVVASAVESIGTAGILVAMATATVISFFLIDFLVRVAGKAKIVYVTAGLGIIAVASGIIATVTGVGS